MKNNNNNETNNPRQRYVKGEKTIGDAIDNLAEAFSGKADTTGLFILEMALEKARELRSSQQRFDEADEIFAEFRAQRELHQAEQDSPLQLS